MKATHVPKNRHERQRIAALSQIGRIGPFLEGHLSAFQRPGCRRPGWHLTFKQTGITHTLYVPLDMVAEVKQWTQNYRLLKKLIRQVTRCSRALIRGHVAARRAATRNQALTHS